MSATPEDARLRHAAKSAAGQLAQVPLLLALVGIAVGTVVAGLGYWRKGSVIIGAAIVFAGLERLVLSVRRAGALAARRRGYDATLLLALGVAIIALAFLVPPSRP